MTVEVAGGGTNELIFVVVPRSGISIRSRQKGIDSGTRSSRSSTSSGRKHTSAGCDLRSGRGKATALAASDSSKAVHRILERKGR